MTGDNNQLTPEQVLFLFDLWVMDIDSVPFAHEDFWTPAPERAT